MAVFIDAEIGDRLVELQKELNMNSRQFALSIGADVSYMGKMERGEKSVSEKYLEEIREKHKVNLVWLLFGEGPMFGPIVPKRKSGASQRPDHTLLTLLKTEIGAMSASLQRLTEALPKPVDPGTNVAGTPGFAKVTSGKKEKKKKP